MSQESASDTSRAEYVFSKDEAHDRYVVHYDDEVVGFAAYRQLGERVHFDHTVVDEEHQGHGVASKLVRFALDDFAQTSTLPLVPDCSYVRSWLDRHPDYQHLAKTRT